MANDYDIYQLTILLLSFLAFVIYSRKMEGQNPYERKYKQLSMLGKGNYGIKNQTQARSTK